MEYENLGSENSITRQDPSASIIFSDRDLDSIKVPYSDLLIIKLRSANEIVSREIVDGGSNSEIIFWEAFKQMRVDQSLISLGTTLVQLSSEH